MVKARLGDCTPRGVPVVARSPLESDDKVEVAMGHLTLSGCNYPRVSFSVRDAHAAFVRMCRKVLNRPGSRVRIAEHLVGWLHADDPLVVTVVPRMIVRPGDRFGLLIIGNVARLIGVLMSTVKVKRSADAAQSAQGLSQILMIASRQDAPATLPKARDASAVRGSKTVAWIDRKQPKLIEIRGIEHA
jgi:hypothetical protein